MLEALLVIVISLPFVMLGRYFYKKSPKYQEDLKDEELRKQDEIENQNLENFINLLENSKKQP